MAADLLLLSSSTVHGGGYLDYATDAIADLIGGAKTVHFAPFAIADHELYTIRVREALARFGVSVIGLHAADDAHAAVEDAEVVFVGGGNSFRLLTALHRRGLIEPIRRRVLAGELRFLGSSAGSNMACPTLRTTNDMPIVQPPSFDAIGLVPFQINPHYVDPDPVSTHMGETREQRIREFLEENDVPVVGLREGAWLRQRGDRLELGGLAGGRLFQRGQEPRELRPGDDLSALLAVEPRFDRPG